MKKKNTWIREELLPHRQDLPGNPATAMMRLETFSVLLAEKPPSCAASLDVDVGGGGRPFLVLTSLPEHQQSAATNNNAPLSLLFCFSHKAD